MTTPRSAALLTWYRRHRRDLPWRGDADPYRVLVSEVMLQQTQASRVADHYVRFLERFPSAEALADASPATVIAAWQGLGYNRRAVRLQQAAARVVVEGWPTTLEGLRTLPGVGPYTAAAVACFAFGRRVVAPDTNAKRVISRWHGMALAGQHLGEAAESDLPADAAAWNQAVMDLGAMVCRPRDPHCDECPVAAWCADPSIYEPPRPQGTFDGSNRQARGAVVRYLIGYPDSSREEITAGTGIGPERMAAAVDSLLVDGLISETRPDSLRLGDG